LKKFSSLPKDTQDYINDRYGTYGIDGEDAFNSFPDELKDLPPEKIEEFLQMKHISHKNPRSKFPDQEDDIENTILEDPDVNIRRSDNIMTEAEINAAEIDNINDIESLSSTIESVDETGFLDVVGGVIQTGVPIMSAIDVGDKVSKGEISTDDIVPYYIDNHGKKTLTYLLIGGAIASSSPFIVSAGVGAIIYKNKSFIKRGVDGINPKTIEDIKKIAKDTTEVVTAPFRWTYYLIRGFFTLLFIAAIIWMTYNSITDWDPYDLDFSSILGAIVSIIGLTGRLIWIIMGAVVLFCIYLYFTDDGDDVLDKYK
tara:strand:- start:379 stop:1317 length:939 start_codon:yes stop_codon:yes gene_type:complete